MDYAVVPLRRLVKNGPAGFRFSCSSSWDVCQNLGTAKTSASSLSPSIADIASLGLSEASSHAVSLGNGRVAILVVPLVSWSLTSGIFMPRRAPKDSAFQWHLH